MAYQPKSYRKFLAGTVSAAVVASAVAPVAAASFKDVPADNVHAEDINTLVEKGYIKGYEDGTFKPNNSLTRGEAAIIFARILKDKGVEVPADKNVFPDVPASKTELAEAAAIVKAAGVMTGDEKGNFNPNAKITRQEMAKVLVEAFKLTKPADFTTKVTDLDKASSWAREYIQILDANGVTKNTEFMPKQNVTRGQFASFVVRALNVGVTPADITEVKFVDENTLEVTFNGELKDVKAEDFKIEGVEIESVSIKAAAAAEAKTTVVVIKTKTKLEEGKTYTISYKGQTSEKAKVEVPVITPKVESVSANNLREVKVTFNKPVDKNTITGGTVKYFINGSQQTITTNYTLTVSEDGKTLTITSLAPVSQGDKLTVELDGVKTVSGEAFAKTTKEVTALDVTVPTVTDVKVVGTNKLEVNFSEPLRTAPTIKVDDGNVSSVISFTAGDSKAIVTTGTLTTGDHKLTVEGGTDYAGLFVAKTDKTFTYSTITTAPVVTVKESTAYSVTLKFDRPVENFTNASTLIRHTYNDTRNEVVGNSANVTKISDTEYKVTFANPFPPGTAKLYITYADGTADSAKIRDFFGNILQPTTLDVTTALDTTKPEVTSVTYDSKEGKVIVKFSEDVDPATAVGATARANYILRDKDGKVVSFGNPTFAANSNSVVELAVGALDAGTYTLEIQNVKDQAVIKNTLDKVTRTFTVGDVKAPTVKSAVKIDAQTVRVTFSEPMNEADILNVANYLFDGKELPAGTTISKYVDSTRVDIKFPAGTTINAGSSTIVVNGAVRDAAGNKIGGFGTSPITIAATSTTAITAADISDVTAAGKNKITFKVNQQLSGIDKSQINIGGVAGATIDTATYVNNPDGTATVTITTTAPIFATNGKAITDGTTPVTVTLNSVGGLTPAAALTNAFGVPNVTGQTVTVSKDALKAEIKSATTADTDFDGQIDQLTVVMSEDVKAGSVQASDFSVEGYVVKDVVSVAGDTVTLALQESGIADTGAKPKVKLVGSVEDLAGNAGYDSTIEITSADGAAPVLLSAVATSATNLRVTFSEPVEIADAVNGGAQFTVDNDDNAGTAAVAGAGAVAAVTGNDNQLDITFAAGTFTSGQDIGAVTYTEVAGDEVNEKGASTTKAVSPQTLADDKTSVGF
ncbi:S-layer homology domain-containing protein [Thermolongibacillus altinsuensis]